MKQKLVTYKTSFCMTFSESESCRVAIAALKKYIRYYLALDEGCGVLISCVQHRDVTETIILIEDLNGAGMNIFKVPKSVRNISVEDIPEILVTPCKPLILKVCRTSD